MAVEPGTPNSTLAFIPGSVLEASFNQWNYEHTQNLTRTRSEVAAVLKNHTKGIATNVRKGEKTFPVLAFERDFMGQLFHLCKEWGLSGVMGNYLFLNKNPILKKSL